MVKNFWQKLPRPILALAPLAGVTDSAFRQVCKKFGAQVVYSEMASAAALYYNPAETLKMLAFSKSERPYVVQLFGADPEQMGRAAKLIAKEIKPDGIDINFGCPVKKVMKQGAGAALMKDLKKSRAVIEAVLENTKLPVSIKVRTQVGGVTLKKFLQNISDLKLAAIMIHGRLLKQLFTGPVDYRVIKEARRYFAGIILANGGINNSLDAQKMLAETGADGLGIGRGALGRPWLFKEIKNYRAKVPTASADIFKIVLAHSQLVHKLKGRAGLLEMRKHLAWYMTGFAGAKKLRDKLVKVETLSDIKKILK
jgi:nifR3 family TIM-barrel protein